MKRGWGRAVLSIAVVGVVLGGVRLGRMGGKASGGAVDTGCGGEDPASTAQLEGEEPAAPVVETETAARGATATLFDWNACYNGHWCVEQWGSFAAACSSTQSGAGDGMGGNVTYWAGHRCRSLCDVNDGHGVCLGGCYQERNSNQSLEFWASAYECHIMAPTASNVTLRLTTTQAVGSYSWSNGGYSATDASTFAWYLADDGSGTNRTLVTDSTFGGSASGTTLSYTSLGTRNLQFCVTPIASGTNYLGTATNSGSETCSTWVPLSDHVSAQNVAATVSGAYAYGTYSYVDSDNLPESGTIYEWWRSSSSSGSSATQIDTAQNHALQQADSGKYLSFCVTPANTYMTGTRVCTSYTKVGAVVDLWTDIQYSGTSVHFAYELAGKGHCFNLAEYSFNDRMSSFGLHTMSSANTYLIFYADANCAGDVYTKSYTLWSSLQGTQVIDTSWNDVVSSVALVWGSATVSASSVGVGIAQNQAQAWYDFSDTSGLTENSSTYLWQRADDSSGSNATSISTSGPTYTLTTADENKYLRFCVTPSDGIFTGSQTCASTWTSVGPLVKLYKDASYSGTNVSLAFTGSTQGTCLNLSDYSFNDVLSSFRWTAASGYATTLTLYQDANCSGSSMNVSASAGQSSETSSLSNTWNDKVSSLRVVWNDSVSASNVSLSFSGAKVTGSYTFASSGATTDSGSTYAFERSSSGSGTGTTVGTSQTYSLSSSDSQQYLRFCVTPSDGYVTGTRQCSGWTAVGHLVQLYKDNLGGTNYNFAYERSSWGTCFNLTDYSFNDVLSSFVWAATSGSGTTLWLYRDINCSGTSATRTLSAGGSESIYSMNATMGSSWNDSVTSIRVTW